MAEGAGGETATQRLHRLVSYEPGRHWTVPADDPRVLRDLQVNDPARLPWFFKRYPRRLPGLGEDEGGLGDIADPARRGLT